MITDSTDGHMQPGWRERFAALQAEARERAKPRPGERLYSLEDLLASPNLPDGTQMDEAFMNGVISGGWELAVLNHLNAYVDFPNVLRRRSARTRDADLPAVGCFHG